MQLYSQSIVKHDETVKLSHGKKPRVWTAQRICLSSRAHAADDPCSHCSSVPVASFWSDASSITKHQWEPLSWRLFNIARDWFHEPLFLGRTWAAQRESHCRMSDWKEVSLLERTSDWSFSIRSLKSKKLFYFFCFFHTIPKAVFCYIPLKTSLFVQRFT